MDAMEGLATRDILTAIRNATVSNFSQYCQFMIKFDKWSIFFIISWHSDTLYSSLAIDQKIKDVYRNSEKSKYIPADNFVLDSSCSRSLRTTDLFPFVSSLPIIFRRERSDDQKYVCGSQANVAAQVTVFVGRTRKVFGCFPL